MRGSTVLGAALTVLAVGVLVRLSVWQWQRGSDRGSLLNYTYAVEWLLLAVLLVVGLILRRYRRGSPSEDGSRDVHGRLIGPPLRPGERPGDPTHVQLKRWLGRHR